MINLPPNPGENGQNGFGDRFIDRLDAIAHGRVQGVFFRATVRDLAHLLSITGTVRNLRDGTVEIVAFGPREKLEKLLAKLEQTPPPAHVTQIDAHWSQSEVHPNTFQISY